jgi:hypothetical protein
MPVPEVSLFRREALDHYLRRDDRNAGAGHVAPRWIWVAILASIAILAVAAIAAFIVRADVRWTRRGYLVVHEVRPVVSGVDGKVLEIRAREGNLVSAGAEIAIVESDDGAALAREAAELRDVITASAGAEGNGLAGLRAHELARLESIERRLSVMPKQVTITAPAEGKLASITAGPGARIAIGSVIARIETAAQPRMVAFVPARDRQCLRLGAAAAITIDCCPQRRPENLHGVVTSMASRENGDRLYRVEVDAPGLRGLAEGTRADISFAITEKQRVAALVFKPFRRWLD